MKKMARCSNQREEVILSYYDYLIRQRDVDLLQGPRWLNDTILGFYFEYLNRTSSSKDIFFISPELTQLLKMTGPEDYSAFLDPLDISQCKILCFALNDCSSKDSVGGSHWSLLVFSRREEKCFHFDSSKGMNQRIARLFSKKIIRYSLDKEADNYVESDCPQQDNGYDCGLFVLCFADLISKSHSVNHLDYTEFKDSVKTKRSKLFDLINSLRHKELG
ncbi:sentrin-specific protease 8-like [Orussus abietinus]|uniref:sentrin-specific protease 8-like n=1 Tax=Orussus abietinus TaxID=222816 RepID=UPI000625601C|nr:sentrin-specific protease 8-like [Orussus abietinus]XP_012282025.1 sentrin-specific protease 8-like [Orussus abietinus]XP_012282035.1 sentrin-specific protease 8-like [Orussus abietinus]XP_012282044.1 sentrin-specific protease 8-like [Orussus abietinus]